MARGTRSDSDLFTVSFGMAVDNRADSVSPRGVSAESLKKYAEILAKGDAWLREGCAAGRDGVGWLALPFRDIAISKRRRVGCVDSMPWSKQESAAPLWAI